ncbi:MAG: sodium:solute symporter family transporter [Gemmatimonadaceae bacterium]
MTGILSCCALVQVALPSAAQPAVVTVGVFYFAVIIAISIWAARRTRTASDFFVAGKGIGLVALTVASVSVSVSGFAFIGGPGLIYAVGLGAMYIVLPAAVTNVMGAWILAKRMRLLGEARNLITIPDAIGARYKSRAAQGLAAIAILVGIIGYMATNALAMGVVIDSIFGVGLGWGIWIGMGVTLAYSASGGILAGIYNDVFQGILMAFASVLVFLFVLGYGGGLGAISHTILAHDPQFLGPWGRLTPLAALSFFFVFSMGSLGQPQAVHKYYMLRDPLQLKWYPLLKTLGLVLVLLLYFSVGIGVKAFVLDGRLAPLTSPDQATPALLLNVTPIILAALVFSGVAAATMSAANSFINIGSAIVTHDLPIAFGRRVRNELGWGRAVTVLIAVAAAITAQRSGATVAFLGIFGWGLFSSTLVPALAVGLNWEGATCAGAMASIATGLFLTLALESASYAKVFTFPAGVTASAVAMVASFIVFFVVSFLTRRSAAAQLDSDVRLVMDL